MATPFRHEAASCTSAARGAAAEGPTRPETKRAALGQRRRPSKHAGRPSPRPRSREGRSPSCKIDKTPALWQPRSGTKLPARARREIRHVKTLKHVLCGNPALARGYRLCLRSRGAVPPEIKCAMAGKIRRPIRHRSLPKGAGTARLGTARPATRLGTARLGTARPGVSAGATHPPPPVKRKPKGGLLPAIRPAAKEKQRDRARLARRGLSPGSARHGSARHGSGKNPGTARHGPAHCPHGAG